jgi:hypothetical protein
MLSGRYPQVQVGLDRRASRIGGDGLNVLLA